MSRELQWQVHATSPTGAVMVFGVPAPDGDQAMALAMERLPFDPSAISVTQIPDRPRFR